MRPFLLTRLRTNRPPFSLFVDSIFLPLCFCSSSWFFSTVTTTTWDPAVCLALNHPTLVLLEKSCTTTRDFKQILAQMMRLHLTSQTFPMSRLLYFAAISLPDQLLDHAILLFKHFTPNPNLFIFNTMISALSFSLIRSVCLYKLMLYFQLIPDEHSLLPLLKECDCLFSAKQIHTHIIVYGFNSHVYLQNSLINTYMLCENQDTACQVFALIPLKDVVTYNTMISSYAKKGLSFKALDIFLDMVHSGTSFDEYTMVGLLHCCGQLKNTTLGKSVHGLVIRRVSSSPESKSILSNGIIDMYAKCGEMKIAVRLFEKLEKKDEISWNIIISGFTNTGEMDSACRYFSESPMKDLISWNSLLGGFAHKGDWSSVTKFFEKMLVHNIKPDKITSAALISAASEMGALDQGLCAHGWAVKAHGHSDAFVGSALIDMYSKCGSCEMSVRVFKAIKDKDIATWTAMIGGLAFHGHGTKALELFEKLRERGLKPNFVTFIAILTACSHSGLVDQGLKVFNDMKQEYGIEPGVEHYGCLTDLLARSGKLAEARDVIKRMVMKSTQSMWGAILSASRAHGDMELAMEALQKLEQLEPNDDGGYILLSNVYASCGRWDYSDVIRGVMGGRGIKKTAGWSSVVVDGVLYSFVSSDKKHKNWDGIHNVVFWLHKEMALLEETL